MKFLFKKKSLLNVWPHSGGVISIHALLQQGQRSEPLPSTNGLKTCSSGSKGLKDLTHPGL